MRYHPNPDMYRYAEVIPHGTRVKCYFMPFNGEMGTVRNQDRFGKKTGLCVKVDGFPGSVFYPAENQLMKAATKNETRD